MHHHQHQHLSFNSSNHNHRTLNSHTNYHSNHTLNSHTNYHSNHNLNGHTNYHANRHRTRSTSSYNPYQFYNQDCLPPHHNQNHTLNPPAAKRRRAEAPTTTTWHRQAESLPREFGLGGGTRVREEEQGFYSRDEIEKCSPSRKDGIDSLTEARLRYSYCLYLKNLGFRLDLPQTTIATAVVLCHRFFLRRSHACHDKFLVATAALFLASKSEESPCLLNTVLRASFEVSQSPEFTFMPFMTYAQDWFEQYRERVIEVEQMILTTLDFELEVIHPYGPLAAGLSKLGLSRTLIYTLACNFITEGVFLPERLILLTQL